MKKWGFSFLVAITLMNVGNATTLFTREYIDDIKIKATTWSPYEYNEHPFKDLDMLKMMGNL